VIAGTARYGTDRVARAVFAAAVPPYLYVSDDNPGGGLDDATIAQFQDGVRGDSDAVVPFEVLGKRTHETVKGAELALIEGGPHGLNATHAAEFNRALLDFLS
jgi:hypothetical protein